MADERVLTRVQEVILSDANKTSEGTILKINPKHWIYRAAMDLERAGLVLIDGSHIGYASVELTGMGRKYAEVLESA